MTDNKEKEEESGPFMIQHSPGFQETDYSYSVKKPPQVNVKSGKTTASKAAKSYRKRLAKRGRQVGYGTAGAAAAAGYGLKKALD